MHYVYVVRSEKDHKLYIGMSRDPDRRLRQHNKGHVKSTKYRRPLELLYVEELSGRQEARKREKYFKTAAGRRLLKITIPG